MIANERLKLVVSETRCEARDVLWVELRAANGGSLPAFTPGSHLELRLPAGLLRHYSLCNDPGERDRYCLAVGLAANSRGGSRHIHRELRAGSTLDCSLPRNNFPLDPDAPRVVFVAGGIGITPILSMIHSCEARARPWQLHYAARSRQRTAFYEWLSSHHRSKCHFHFDDEAGGWFDASAALGDIAPDAAIYCCGPAPLMSSVQALTAQRAPGRAHFEWFSAEAAPPPDTHRSFTIVLASSGRRLEVPPHQTILDVLEAHGEGVPFSCREGLCGTCKTGVIAGLPDHRDHVLSPEEQASNRVIAVCVSRATSDVLELEL